MMDALNTPQFALMCLLAFVLLSAYSYHREIGYNQSAFSVLDRMPKKMPKKQAEGLNSVWASIPTAELNVKLPEDWK